MPQDDFQRTVISNFWSNLSLTLVGLLALATSSSSAATMKDLVNPNPTTFEDCRVSTNSFQSAIDDAQARASACSSSAGGPFIRMTIPCGGGVYHLPGGQCGSEYQTWYCLMQDRSEYQRWCYDTVTRLQQQQRRIELQTPQAFLQTGASATSPRNAQEFEAQVDRTLAPMRDSTSYGQALIQKSIESGLRSLIQPRWMGSIARAPLAPHSAELSQDQQTYDDAHNVLNNYRRIVRSNRAAKAAQSAGMSEHRSMNHRFLDVLGTVDRTTESYSSDIRSSPSSEAEFSQMTPSQRSTTGRSLLPPRQ